MVDQLTDGGGVSDGLINPMQFLFRSSDIDVGSILTSATTMQSIGSGVETQMDAIGLSWQGLEAPQVYRGPEQEQVYAVMSPAQTAARELNTRFNDAALLLADFAQALDEVRPRLVALEDDAYEFRTEALRGYSVTRSEAEGALSLDLYQEGHGGYLTLTDEAHEMVTIPWTEHQPAIERNAALFQERDAIIGIIDAASVACANGIDRLCDGPLASGGEAGEYEAITFEDLQAAGADNPFGAPATEDRNCTESVGYGLQRFGESTLQGAGSLIGHDPATGEWSGETAWSSWLGVGDFFGSTLVLTVPLVTLAGLVPGPVGDWVQQRRDVALTGWGSIIGYDHQAALAGENGFHLWVEDGVAAATETAANIGTFFIPVAGVAGGAARLGILGTRAGLLVSRALVAGAEFVIPAGSWLVRGGIRVIELGAGLFRGAPNLPAMPVTAAAGGLRLSPWYGLIDAALQVSNRSTPNQPQVVQAPSVSQPASTGVSDVLGLGAATARATPESPASVPVEPNDTPAGATGAPSPSAAPTARHPAVTDADLTPTNAHGPVDSMALGARVGALADAVPAPSGLGEAPVSSEAAQALQAADDLAPSGLGDEAAGSGHADAGNATAEAAGRLSPPDVHAPVDDVTANSAPESTPGRAEPSQAAADAGITRPEVTQSIDVTRGDWWHPRTPFAARADLEPNTVYHVEGRGDFYTDAFGMVRYVEASYGRWGVNWDLNRPQPNVTYAVTPSIRNPVDGVDYTQYFVTDDLARVEQVFIETLAVGEARRSSSIQRAIGKLGGPGYEGSHLAPNWSGGGTERVNLQAWTQSLNRGGGEGSYSTIEAWWRAAANADPPIAITQVRVTPNYSGHSVTPISIVVGWLADGVPERLRLKNV